MDNSDNNVDNHYNNMDNPDNNVENHNSKMERTGMGRNTSQSRSKRRDVIYAQ